MLLEYYAIFIVTMTTINSKRGVERMLVAIKAFIQWWM